jgi:hypothetical protein
MSENINPLMDFARVISCSVKLPTNGVWYNDGNIGFNNIGEVDIKPMLPKDELLMSNPETLITGETINQVIKSCCPSVSDASSLYYPDVNALLLGIHKATYGDEMTINGVCPKCLEKKQKMINELVIEKSKKKVEEKIIAGGKDEITTDELNAIEEESKLEIGKKIDQMEIDNEIRTKVQSRVFSIEYILAQMTFLPSEKIIESENGLKIYLAPYKCKEKVHFTVKNIHTQKTLQSMYNKLKSIDEESVEQREMMTKEINEAYETLTQDAISIVSTGIEKIVIPSGFVVTDKNHIEEFLKNSDIHTVKKISDIINELTEIGVPSSLPFKCECCGYEWKELFHGYNPSDFFGNRSW